MKLYLTAKNERNKRPATIGANEKIQVELSCKGIPEYVMQYDENGIQVEDNDGNTLLKTENSAR